MPILGDGQVFERYRIVRWLGSGYTGESYEAEDRMLLRKVTLKLIHPWATLPDSARRQFFREMQGISALNHPYLAAVLDYGESDGRLYVARRYVSSGSLLGTNGRLWYRPPLAVAAAFTYTHQLAQVLHHIHQHGYLHGSLTFTNVLVLRGPNVEQETEHVPFLAADTGLANFVRRFGNPQVATLPVSAAPEQLGKRVTPASDQFALAVLLYFWLTGRPPYLGTSEEVEKLKLSGKVTPPSALNPELTAEQDRIILRALAVYPEERHASVLAFAEALQNTHPLAMPARGVPFATLLVQPETPRTLLHVPLNEAPLEKADEEDASARPAESSPQFPAETSDPQVSTQVQSASREAAPSSSALDERLSPTHPASTEWESGSQTEEASGIAISEPAPSLLPTLPETPRPQESESTSALALGGNEQPAIPQDEMPPSAGEQAAPSDETASVSAEAPSETGEVQGGDNPPAQVNEVNAGIAGSPAESESSAPGMQPEARSAADTLPRLIVCSPYTNSSYEFVLINEEVNIGRAGSSDLHLEQDELTSRHHALLKREGKRVLLFDKRSYNGVFVNGQQIEVGRGYELTDGDHISIGNYELIYRSAPHTHSSQLS
jgi:serine/threonine protein kinase